MRNFFRHAPSVALLSGSVRDACTAGENEALPHEPKGCGPRLERGAPRRLRFERAALFVVRIFGINTPDLRLVAAIDD